MRNLAQYPLTVPEILLVLSNMQVEIANEKRMGDMRPMILQAANLIVAGSLDVAAEVLAEMNPTPPNKP